MALTDQRKGDAHDEGADHVDRQGAIRKVATEQQREQFGHAEPQAGTDGATDGNK
ncbi:hypothetical protein D3C71_2068250 [compost metagenome]